MYDYTVIQRAYTMQEFLRIGFQFLYNFMCLLPLEDPFLIAFSLFRSTAGLEVVPTLEKLYMSNNELQVRRTNAMFRDS